MQSIQTLIILLVGLILAWLLVDGWLTRAVWVKGARDGLFSFRHWAHKRGRDDEPGFYWFAMVFYSTTLICLCWLLLTG